MSGLDPGVGEVTTLGLADALGVKLMTALDAELPPPPAVNCAKALNAREGANNKMTIWK
jgi:hypothetical protein